SCQPLLLLCSVLAGPVDELLASVVRGAEEVQLEREALFVAVTAVYVLRVDPVQCLLRRPDHPSVLAGDFAGQRHRSVSELVAAPSAPRSTSATPNVASSEASTTSALPTRPTPPPRQNPCTSAITGTAQS